jgi:hypothetical protein
MALGFDELVAIFTARASEASQEADGWKLDHRMLEEAGFDPEGVTQWCEEFATVPAAEYTMALREGNAQGLWPDTMLEEHAATALCAFQLAVAAINRMRLEEQMGDYLTEG